MASILRQRRDTAANWANANPVIPDGQLVFDTTNEQFRIGNGTDNYADLDVLSGTQGPTGPTGPTGATGATGPAGADGSDGVDGVNGTDGAGFTGGSYNSTTGVVTFTSDDGLGFSTTDIRGADGADGSDGADGATGAAGADGADGINGTDGADGTGFTGGSYNSSTGVVTFTSDDGLGFSTGDLRGADGADGSSSLAQITGSTYTNGQDWLNTTFNACYLDGGAVTVGTENGNATIINVAALNGFIQENGTGDLKFFSLDSWANEKGSNLLKEDLGVGDNYLYINSYDSGGGVIVTNWFVSTSDGSSSSNGSNKIRIATINRDSVSSSATLTVTQAPNVYTQHEIKTHIELEEEHIDWTVSQTQNIHSGNYTDTTYSVGDGGLTEINFTSADNTKLDGIETGATADQTDAEIKTAYENNSDTNAFTDALLSKLNNIEASADVTDTTNVVAALSAGNGVTISGGGEISVSDIALTTVQTASSQSAMLALTTEEGDVVVRTDENKSYIKNSGTAGTMADFTELLAPTDAVTSVAGKTGTVTLVEADITDFGSYEPADATIVKDADIGVTVQGYDADTAKYDDTTANFTGTLQNGGSNVIVDSDIGSTVQAYDSTILNDADIGVTVQAYDSTILNDADIGSTVQGYDVDTAKLDVTQNFTKPQRSSDTVDNDGSFDLDAAQNFTCTPTGNFTLTFTNIPDGQSGTIVLVNSGGHTVSAASTTKVMGSSTLTDISTAGTYVLGYISDGTNVRVYPSGAEQ